ncbi:hypothetical protein E1L24_23395 [Salmonella enterica subsp. enterica serovar Braenderup]|nr:hypothetical protein [Salmonella enterica subsp. enterica serovar Braenderup]
MAATNQMMLVALYNAANTELPHQLTVEEVSFGQPTALESEGKNTKVTMTALAGSENFKGSIELKYDRLEPGVVGRIELTDELSSWAEQNELRAWLQYYINRVKPDDVIHPADVAYSTEDQKDEHDNVTLRTVTCTVTERNLRYKPGVMATFVITPRVEDNRIDLATTNGELDGFTA